MKKIISLITLLSLALCLSVPSFADECVHQWSDWITEEGATCAEEGSKSRYCTICYKEEWSSIPATGDHEWSDWEIEKKATVFKKGKAVKYCDYCDNEKVKTIARIKPFAKFKKKVFKVKRSKTLNLKSKIKLANGDKVTKWKSANKSIATVTKKGKIKAKKKGTVKIIAITKAGKKATCKVKVTLPKKKVKRKPVSSTVYWTPYGKVYHSTRECPTLSRSRVVVKGSLSACPKSRGCKICY